MSQRGKRTRRSNKTVAYTAAGIIHVALIGALFVNFAKDKPEVVDAAYAEKVDVVRATTVDQAELKKHQDLIKQQDRAKEREKELEQQQLKDLQAQAQQEKDRIADLKKQQEQEKLKAAEIQKEREALALKRKEEEQAEKELAEQKKKLVEEQKQKEALAKQQRDEQEAEMQRLLQEQLAAEEAFLADQVSKERTTTLISKYSALIKQAVEKNKRISPNTESWRVAKINIKLSPLGVVQSARIIESSGSVQFDREVESAVLKSSPLPIADPETEKEANAKLRDLNLTFNAK